jgi:arylsulfatase A-like enzyme
MPLRPNILLLMADQQRAETLEPGGPCQTPNLDRLAQRGVRFTHALTPNAVCSPARASLFTGLYPSGHGMVDCTHSVPAYRADLVEGLTFWSQRLHEAGYAGGYFGKWHVERSNELSQFGFDEFIAAHGGPDYEAYRQSLGLTRERSWVKRHMLETPGYRDLFMYGVTGDPPEALEPYFLYSKGIDFIRAHAPKASSERNEAGGRSDAGGSIEGEDAPWFCVVSTLEPHDPYVAPRHWYERYRPEELALPVSLEDDLREKPGIQRRLRGVWHT